MAHSRRHTRIATAALAEPGLADVPAAARWRDTMGRVEALIFAATRPVTRDDLVAIVGAADVVDDLIADIRAELRGRPYDIVAVAGGWQFCTRAAFADVLRAVGITRARAALTPHELQVLAGVAYHQPITRGGLCALFGRDIGRDVLADLRADGLIATGPRSPRPGAPVTYVTSDGFLQRFGLESLQDLPELDALDTPLASEDDDKG